jgi:hypothetical protein
MIKKLKVYDKHPTAPLTTVLDSEWDVLSALHRALQWFKRYPRIKWKKGNQDNIKVFEKTEMPLDSYLNSEADKLATTGLKKLREKPTIPMDPNTEVQFHIQGRTITRDFKRTVREIIQITTATDSTGATTYSISLTGTYFDQYKKYISTKGVQCMHKPTGESVHTRDHFYDKRCASCWHTLEDDDHILQCSKRRSI